MAPAWTKRLGTLQALVAATVLAAIVVDDVFFSPSASVAAGGGGGGGSGGGSLLLRPQSRAAVSSSTAGAAGSLANAPRALVVAKFREDAGWVDLFFGDVPHFVYHMGQGQRGESARGDGAGAVGGAPAALAAPLPALAMPKNVGNEATAYLRFIVEHYDALPERTAFVQAHRFAHHTHKVDIVPLLLTVNWEWADYVPLNLYMFQHLRREKSPEFAAIQDLWPVLFEEVGPAPPPDLLTWCCAQFIVSRAAIRRLSLAHWRRLYDWILSEEMRRLRSGVIMEHAWPIMLDAVKHEANVEPCDLLNCTEFERLRDMLAGDG